MNILINYTSDSRGFPHTNAIYFDEDGVPMAARFPAWLNQAEFINWLQWCRQHDRNREADTNKT